MSTENMKCKLAAILSADVKGYSRLMGEDEVGTIRTLYIYKEVMTGFIQNHQGRGRTGASLYSCYLYNWDLNVQAEWPPIPF